MSETDILRDLSQDQRVLLRPLLRTTRCFWIWAIVLGAITLWGAFAYFLQIRYGLGVTGLNTPEYWGIYIINFVFFIGISHAGTLISAILRISQAEWRRAITRSAEFIAPHQSTIRLRRQTRLTSAGSARTTRSMFWA